MSSKLVQSHIELTETIIKQAFMKLFAEQPLDKITVSNLCKQSGVSRSAFYQHFDDKYAVLESIEDSLLNDLKALNKEMKSFSIMDEREVMPNFTKTIEYIYDHRAYFTPLISSPGDTLFIHRWKALMQEDFLRRLKTDNALPEKNAEIIVSAMTSAMIGMYEYWLTKNPDLDSEELARLGTRLLWNSFYK